jgi:N-methylhydantoinase A/oxoprolinase/acetone carboxylase beta subunit
MELDEEACRKAVEHLIERERCAALVVAGYCTIRNPVQANRVREIIRERANVPVVCAHEVSRRLNAIQCAQTAVANARLLPVIEHLLDSVRRALADFAVPGRLSVVKGDGTPVDEAVARARPIETILSGPAASVSGARILTGLQDALVMDVGGTTTDCAILNEGRVAVAPEGARVGQWVMSVDVVEISTVGLGGDSRIDFTPEREIVVGPMRNVPLAYLAGERPSVRRFLERFDRRLCRKATDASALDVLIAGADGNLDLTAPEAALMALVAEGPIPAVEAAARLGVPTHRLLPLARLEQTGMVKRGALTPTDLLHVTGEFVRWDAEASRLALALWAEMYGMPVAEVAAAMRKAITRRMFEQVVRREVSHDDRRLHELPADWRFLLDRAFEPAERGLRVRLSLDRPLIAIGAPAGLLAGPVRERLDAEVIVPEHADVANAIGAIATEVTMTDEVLIQPGFGANYVLHGVDERMVFADLQSATDVARSIARERARARAIAAGARSPAVTLAERDSSGATAHGGSIFLERRIVATATGSAFIAHPASPEDS